MNVGQLSDLFPTDPTFVLRRVGPRAEKPMTTSNARQGISSPDPHTPLMAGNGRLESHNNTPGLSPQEIIAAQRAATRANQRALISAHNNTKQGVDVVLPDRGTFRSSRLLEAGGEVVRYSFIDDNGETYDISEIIAEEWASDEGANALQKPQAPALIRHGDSSASNYVTAPSTPMEEQETPRGSEDILQDVLARAQGQEGKLEEKLQRVISKVKSWRPLKSPTGDRNKAPTPTERDAPSGRATPQGPPSRTTTPQPPGGFNWDDSNTDTTPRANPSSVGHGSYASHEARSDSRNGSRQANYEDTATSVNRIISRHHQRQQPSIASIMSDLSTSPTGDSRERVSREPSLDPMTESNQSSMYDNAQESSEDLRGPPGIRGDGTRSSTPLTATSSTHPTPPFSSIGVFTRSLSSASPTQRVPVSSSDDFGLKNLMAIIDVRSRDWSKKPKKVEKVDEVQDLLYGKTVNWEGIHPEIKGCFVGTVERLDRFDKEVDELLAMVAGH